MKNNSLKWLWRVTGKKKYYIAALTLIQAPKCQAIDKRFFAEFYLNSTSIRLSG